MDNPGIPWVPPVKNQSKYKKPIRETPTKKEANEASISVNQEELEVLQPLNQTGDQGLP